MSTKKYETILLNRFRNAGHESNQLQLDAPFSFVVSPTTTFGVDANESGALAREFGDGIVENIAQWNMQSPIKGVVVFPRILDGNIARIPDHQTFKRKERAVFIGVNIAFDEWISSAVSRRIDILAETIVEALRRIDVRHLRPDDRNRLIQAVFVVRDAMRLDRNLRQYSSPSE